MSRVSSGFEHAVHTRRTRLACASGAAVLASSLVTSAAFADALPEARDLFTRGRDLRAGGDCPGAVPLFRRAYEVYPEGLGSLRNVAECEELIGHVASARHAWLDLQRALATNHDRKYVGWSEDAFEGAGRLAPRVAKLTVDINAVTESGETAAGADVDVTVNGERLAPDLIGSAVERDPGRYLILAVAGGRTQGERVVVLRAGDEQRVAMRVVSGAMLGVRGPENDAERAGRRERTAAWIATGVGVAGLVGAGLAFLVRQAALDDFRTACQTTDRCVVTTESKRAEMQSIVDRGNTATTLGYVLGAVGLASAGTAVVLFAIRPAPSAATALVVSPTGIFATGRF